MEETLKKIIEVFETQIKITEQLVSDIRKTLGEIRPVVPAKRKKGEKAEEPAADLSKVVIEHACGCKIMQDPKLSTFCAEHKKNIEAADAKKAAEDNAAFAPAGVGGEPVPHAEGGALQVKDVTIEMIRERSTVYSDQKNFGMDAWLALAQKVTGQKKVKDIPKEMYGAFYAAMDDELNKLAKDRATLSKPSLSVVPDQKPVEPMKTPAVAPGAAVKEITLEQLREKAKVFMDSNGQPALVALTKAFGATKLSEIAKEKYPAFLEAISNV